MVYLFLKLIARRDAGYNGYVGRCVGPKMTGGRKGTNKARSDLFLNTQIQKSGCLSPWLATKTTAEERGMRDDYSQMVDTTHTHTQTIQLFSYVKLTPKTFRRLFSLDLIRSCCSHRQIV